jgi:hypothetical protein
MANPGNQNITSAEAETAVPTLKVMRLQKPDLHMVGDLLGSVELNQCHV